MPSIMIDVLFNVAISSVNIFNWNHTWLYSLVLFLYAFVCFIRLRQFEGRIQIFIFCMTVFIFLAAIYQVIYIITHE